MDARFGSIEDLIEFISKSSVAEVDKLLLSHGFNFIPKQNSLYKAFFDTEIMTANEPLTVDCEQVSITFSDLSKKVNNQYHQFVILNNDDEETSFIVIDDESNDFWKDAA